MWLLLITILINGQVDSVKILEIHYSKQDCLNSGDRASELGIPIGMTLNCIPLKGVTKAYAQKLQ